jgi:hypothetical protein
MGIEMLTWFTSPYSKRDILPRDLPGQHENLRHVEHRDHACIVQAIFCNQHLKARQRHSFDTDLVVCVAGQYTQYHRAKNIYSDVLKRYHSI